MKRDNRFRFHNCFSTIRLLPVLVCLSVNKPTIVGVHSINGPGIVSMLSPKCIRALFVHCASCDIWIIFILLNFGCKSYLYQTMVEKQSSENRCFCQCLSLNKNSKRYYDFNFSELLLKIHLK